MAQSPAYFVGIDGGGSKTAVVVTDRTGEILAFEKTGPSNKNAVGIKTAWKNCNEGIKTCVNKLNAKYEDIKGICFTLSGCDSEADKKLWRDEIGSTFSCEMIIENDSLGGVGAATKGSRKGIVCISGTGMIVVGWDKVQLFRVGGWGPKLGDVGCAFALGEAVLRAAAFHACDGPKTQLHDIALKHAGAESFEEMIKIAYADNIDWAWTAAFAKLAFDAPADPVALQIIDDQAKLLADRICVAIRKFKQAQTESETVPIVCIGGLIENPVFRNKVAAWVRKVDDDAEFILPPTSSAHGAALIAKNMPH